MWIVAPLMCGLIFGTGLRGRLPEPDQRGLGPWRAGASAT